MTKENTMDFIDFSQEEQWHSLFHGSPESDDPAIKELDQWLRGNPNAFVRLYHGTAKDHPIMASGLLPTTSNRRNSLQSRSGYVSLSVYESNARTFGELAYPGKEIEVYAVTMCVRSLTADKDQLFNQRCHVGRKVKNSLAHSLVFGHGAQVKGKVDPWYIQPLSLINGDVEDKTTALKTESIGQENIEPADEHRHAL
jgi:hypothetical protein